jgi:hypothetical protein
MEAVEATASSITLSWTTPEDVTELEVSWEPEGSGKRAVCQAEGGSSGRLPGTANSYTITDMRSCTSYTIILTFFNPAGSSSTSFTLSTSGDGDNTCEDRSSSEALLAAAAVGSALAVVTVVAIVEMIVIIVILVRRGQRTDAPTVSEDPDKFQTTTNEAYSVVRVSGGTAGYEILPPLPSTHLPQTPSMSLV